ncbi:patatin-like phospholipase family protein [Tessaracoccus sp. OS52]|uniref:patatin-like phospholipase family protein n=1 Tax=Tessaracoccus sp. OS52 TaxID=2886691 RepID=UPI001D1240DC|nr:patatin-like phospholipase family protein [Tessaracoccus sp. OS52]MCC2593894.1 patatin-like phospholipase family protein [Tessaracoccus sp. OS52]
MTTTPDQYAAAGLECDIVMKGGITSGVIYPQAVSRLARVYRLRSVGGASAGAIAAAAAAAAELGRATGGFEELDRMPQDLATTGPDGRSTLATFFQPTPTAAPLFRVLSAVDGKEGGALYGAVAGVLLRGFWKEALAGALPGLVLVVLSAMGEGIAAVAGVVAGLLVLLAGLVLGVVLGVKRTLAAVAADGYGMCTGMPGVDSGDATALTPWLHQKFQSLAGRGAGEPPLTFGDLERGGVTLRMMTSNLTKRQPMAMPWRTGEYFFDPDELRRVFPADVVEWMVDNPPELPGGQAGRFDAQLLRQQAGRLRPWPAADKLPILVATRMSLSFPVLITAVRLQAVDYTQPANREARDAVPGWRRANPDGTVEQALATLPAPSFSNVWFTDGGLCSNLPVHFFDTPLPKRPTFAFNLDSFPPGREKSSDQADNSYLPTDNRSGMQRPWYDMSSQGLGGWKDFLMQLFHTAREWVDAAQLVLPGYRDRIVTVYHDHSEGGMNLTMPPPVVGELALRGALGAEKLVTAFASTGPGHIAPGWENHRWVRFRTATAGLSDWLERFVENYQDPTPHATPYSELAGPGAQAPLPSYRPSKSDRELINQHTGALVELGERWRSDDALTASAPKSRPQLRLVPDDGTAAGLEESSAPPPPPAD